MKNYEIERKFLLKPCAPRRFLRNSRLGYRRYLIQQYYLPKQNGEYIRYRRKNDNYFKTIKSGDGMVRKEYEYRVSKEEFEAHMSEHTGIVIEKMRYVFDYRGITYELDNFLNTLRGLCYLEIEFDSEREARRFVLPEIFSGLYVAEVTDDSRFNNSMICLSGTVPALREPLKNRSNRGFVPFESCERVLEYILRGITVELEGERQQLLLARGDPEVLHRFRVTLRKARSIVKFFREQFSEEWYRVHARNLALLMGKTDARRDIDVLLVTLPRYGSLLPKKLRKKLYSLETLLLDRKSQTDADIASLAEHELLNYEIFTLAMPKFAGRVSEQPIVITAIHSMERAFERISRKGKKLGPESKEHSWRKLRIEFKRFRYFIDMMEPLIERETYKRLQKRIKTMQALLGKIHDCQVGRKLLRAIKKEPLLQKRKQHKAVQKLIGEIAREEEHRKSAFERKFQKFLRSEKRFHTLFESE